MSHHYSGPNYGFPNGDARVDFTDLFAFPKPGDAGKSVLVMDVHPSAGVNPPGPTSRDAFAPGAIYEFRVDTNGDAVADLAYRVRFSPLESRAQNATVQRVEGAAVANPGADGAVVVANAPVSLGREPLVTTAGDYRFFAGLRGDPFFFDVMGVLNNFQFTDSDFFADKDVRAIVLEVPNRALGANSGVGLWARVLVPAAEATTAGAGTRDGWVQVDRGARPSQSNFLIEGELKAAYLAGEPAEDRERYLAAFAHSLEHASHCSPERAVEAARTLLPDILPYDYRRPVQYPQNGRSLTDDVADLFLGVLTNGQVTTDRVGPHGDLLAEFPHLAAPHEV